MFREQPRHLFEVLVHGFRVAGFLCHRSNLGLRQRRF
jgi:hypothetical protein